MFYIKCKRKYILYIDVEDIFMKCWMLNVPNLNIYKTGSVLAVKAYWNMR